MRKYGKYERRPEGVPVKQPKVKNMLLQTYFTSLICLVLCVTMFFGTTYAWFTSEVENKGNEILIGTLKVDLQNEGGTSLKDSSEKIFDNTVRWEPGYTALETVKVVDMGDLAFKYVLNFTEGTLTNGTLTNGSQDLSNVADLFEVFVFNHQGGTGYTKPASYEAMKTSAGWTPVGTLEDVLNGQVVLSGEMLKADVLNENPEHTYTIALHMKEDATTDVMGYKISLNVKLVAYQLGGHDGAEDDGFGNTYDQMVSSEEELRAALQKGGNVALIKDITVQEQLTIPENVVAALDLNGYTISQERGQTAHYSMIKNNGTLTIKDSGENGTISYADTIGGEFASNTVENRGILNVEGGIIENISSDAVANVGYPHAIDVYEGSVTNITGGTVKSANYDAIRMFCNSAGRVTTVNISGGNIINRVSFQNPNRGKNLGVLNITGGTFTTTEGVSANVRLLNDGDDVSGMKATISGGTFDKGVKTQILSNGVSVEQSAWLTIENVTVPTVQ